MNNYTHSNLRNVALVGHASSGKTMLGECMLACSGNINRLGSVIEGTTASDYHKAEQERQFSIHTSLLHAEWLDTRFNIIDTPGYLDFLAESRAALKVADLALVVVHATHGIEIGTSKVWEYAEEFGLAKAVVVNGIDAENAQYEPILEELGATFGKRFFPVNIPTNPGPGFNEALDVIRKSKLTYKTDGSGNYDEAKASGDEAEQVEQLHAQLIELVAESDDSLLEKFFDEGITEEELRGGLHQAFQSQIFVPVFFTSSETNVGVARLMDFISKYASSPDDHKDTTAKNPDDEEVTISLDDNEAAAFVFKTINEPHIGELSFVKVMAGTLKAGEDVVNANTDEAQRLGQMFILNGKNRDKVEQLNAGEIGALVKLKNTHTGNTLTSPKRKVTVVPIDYPNPNIHEALKPKNKGDEDKIAVGLSALHEEDPSFQYHVDSELHQTVISGQGELHLQVAMERIKERFNIEMELSAPKIPFRETIRNNGEAKYRHKKQSGGAGQFAEVWMRIEPAPRDHGVEFTQSLVGQNVDRVFVPSVEKGVNSACTDGILAGYRVVDVKIDFYDGKMHPVDSKDVAFQIAGKQAFREAFKSAKPCLLEPITKIEVSVPEEFMGAVMGDLSSRRGKILGMDAEGAFQVVRAEVPQMELYHYSTNLRSLTGGRGLHTEEFSHYEFMPHELEKKVTAQSQAKEEE
ncbi:MAG: elongation factor G [Verrucomicrobiales bacterium]|jgi:elongation factor G|nr:elongation factor G [Verrucomicrobiales bacterium]MDP6678156.1 elongation factor G [Verrucomicrobiota bacterium]MDP6752616.1 elongation factor G [Verrucomicrobiota bacterium]MDP7013094.1 elongation factor G [Verrucomicrobiota bacterium]